MSVEALVRPDWSTNGVREWRGVGVGIKADDMSSSLNMRLQACEAIPAYFEPRPIVESR